MAGLAKAQQQVVVVTRRLHQDALGQLQFEALRRQAGLGHDRRDILLQRERHLELHRGEVDRNQRWSDASIEPLLSLAASFLQDPPPKRHNQTVHLCFRDEATRSQQP